MNVNDMLWFKRVAERASVHRAAQDLGISQPALSKAVRRMEAALGLTLFERTPRGMLLTDAGRTVYERATEAADWLSRLHTDVDQIKTAKTGVLRVGVVPALVEPLLVPSVQALLSTARLSVRVQLSDALFQLLEQGETDCAVAAMSVGARSEFNYQALGQQRSMVVGRKAHPLARRRFDEKELCRQRWILPPKHIVLRQWLDEFRVAHGGVETPAAIEVDATPAVLAPLIERTDLLTVLTEDALQSSICRGLRSLPPPAPTWAIEIGLFWRRTAPFSALMGRFRELSAHAYARRRAMSGRP